MTQKKAAMPAGGVEITPPHDMLKSTKYSPFQWDSSV